MVATLCLLGCALVPAQPLVPPPGGDWTLSPRLESSQELHYTGTFSEQASGSRVHYSRAYKFETRVFTLETTSRTLDLAILTQLRDKSSAAPPSGKPGDAKAKEEPPAGSVRLERVKVDLQGKVTPDVGVSLAVPLEGPPSVECGMFVVSPRARVSLNDRWTVAEPGRPEWNWKGTGTEMVNGTSCLKLVGVQQTDDWDKPRGDRTAWRRQDTVWVASPTGVAERVERVVEQRAPARQEPTQKSVLSYELQVSPRYTAGLVEDRKRDILQAHQFGEAAKPLLTQPARNTQALKLLLAKITAYLDGQQSKSPYREAVVQVRRRVEAGLRGETPPSLAPESTDPVTSTSAKPRGFAVGRAAPEFVAPDLIEPTRTAALRYWAGKPLLLVFYNPEARNLQDMMGFVERLAAKHKEVVVVGLAMTEDGDKVRKQRRSEGWAFPVLGGMGLTITYAVECTPKLVLIDAGGVVRAAFDGWGPETAEEVGAEVPVWLRK